MSPPTQGRMIGVMPCPNCATEIPVRVTKKNHLYFTCPKPADGGCGQQTFNRDARSDELTAKKITRWRSKEDHEKFTGGAVADKPAPASDAAPKNAPAVDKSASKQSWWDREL